MDRINVAIIGAGGIAKMFHLPELARVRRARIYALVDRRIARARKLAGLYDVPVTVSDHRKVLEDERVHAVVVATYHPTHASIAMEALEAGKHVVVQKPMATSLRDASALVRKAASSDRVVLALPYLHTPGALLARRLAADGAIGRVHTVRARVAHGGPEGYERDTQRFFRERRRACWFLDREAAEGGALFDMGVYAATEVTSLLGAARSVRGVALRIADSASEVDDNAALLVEFASGALGIAETSWSQRPMEHGVTVYGTGGTIRFPHGRRPLAIWRGDAVRPEFPRPAYRRVTAHRHFIDCIVGGRRPLSTPEQGRHVVEILLAGYRSQATGRAVRIRSSYDPAHAIPGRGSDPRHAAGP